MRSYTPYFIIALLVLIMGQLAACQRQTVTADVDVTDSVWAVDLVRTLPGAQMDYLRSIETNWANARHIAREQGAVISYRALVALPDTARGWDVLLMTEYADSLEWSNREATFEAIFASPEFVRVEPARPSAEMRRFVASNLAMRAFVSEPQD